MKKLFIIIALVGVAGAAYLWLKAAQADASLYYTVRRGDFEEKISVRGEVEALYYVGISAPDSPYEKQITYIAPAGSFVKKGEVIARFDEAAVLTAIEDKEEGLYSRQFELENIEVSWDIEEYEMSVNVSSSENKLGLYYEDAKSMEGFYPYMFDLANLQYSSVKSEYRANRVRMDGSKQINEDRIARYKGNIRHQEYRIFRDEAYLDEYTIVAPMDSMVVLPYKLIDNKWRQSEVGDFLNKGYEFMRLPDFNEMGVMLKIDQSVIKNVAKGDKVTFRPISDKSKTFEGSVSSIANLAVEDIYKVHKKLFDVVVKIEVSAEQRAAHYFLPGMVVDADVTLFKSADEFALPKDFVFDFEGAKSVRIFDAEKKSERIVKLKEPREGLNYYFVPPAKNPELGKEFTLVYAPQR